MLGGGPGSANPLPLAPFFDAFFIGEAEGRLAAIVAALEARHGAPSACARLGAVPGVWLPHAPAARPGRAQRQVFMGFSQHAARHRAPSCRCSRRVHDRVVMEVMRGCTAGCRFCQAGMWYRPVRERPGRHGRRRPPTRCSTRPAATRSR